MSRRKILAGTTGLAVVLGEPLRSRRRQPHRAAPRRLRRPPAPRLCPHRRRWPGRLAPTSRPPRNAACSRFRSTTATRPGRRSSSRSRASRTPSRANKYQGVMLVNPGGPGGSGVGLSILGQFVPNHAGDAYDWIGFDPRGVGSQHSVPELQAELLPQRPAQLHPDVAVAGQHLADDDQELCRRLRKRQPALLQHMKTIDSAKDMESIRLALGAPADQLLRLLLRHLPRPGLQHALPDPRAADGARLQRRSPGGLVRRQPRPGRRPSTATSTSGSAGSRSTTTSTTWARPQKAVHDLWYSQLAGAHQEPGRREASARTNGPTRSCSPATTSSTWTDWVARSLPGSTTTT